MVLPLWDENPFKAEVVPVVTWGLIALNVLIFVVQIASPGDAVSAAALGFGTIPAAVLHLDPVAVAMQHDESGGWLRPELTVITSMFLHGDLLHLAGNMLFLSVFGDNIEHVLGRGRFLIFYLLCGVGATLVYIASASHSTEPLVGASGAIAGVVAAYAMVRPCAKITVLVFNFFMRVRAFWVVAAFVGFQVFQTLMQASDGVAYWAHIGGLAFGALLFLVFKGQNVALFNCPDYDTEPAVGPGSSPGV